MLWSALPVTSTSKLCLGCADGSRVILALAGGNGIGSFKQHVGMARLFKTSLLYWLALLSSAQARQLGAFKTMNKLNGAEAITVLSILQIPYISHAPLFDQHLVLRSIFSFRGWVRSCIFKMETSRVCWYRWAALIVTAELSTTEDVMVKKRARSGNAVPFCSSSAPHLQILVIPALPSGLLSFHLWQRRPCLPAHTSRYPTSTSPDDSCN